MKNKGKCPNCNELVVLTKHGAPNKHCHDCQNQPSRPKKELLLILIFISAFVISCLLGAVIEEATKSAYLGASVALFIMTFFIILARQLNILTTNDLQDLSAIVAILAIIIAIVGLNYTNETITYAKEQSALVQEQLQKSAIISVNYPWGPLPQDKNISTGFWIANTGYRPILLFPECTLFVKCDDLNELTYNLASAEVIRIITDSGDKDFNFFETGMLVLKIGDLAYFSTPNQVEKEFVIDSNRLKGLSNCFVSCDIRDLASTRIGDANIPITMRQ